MNGHAAVSCAGAGGAVGGCRQRVQHIGDSSDSAAGLKANQLKGFMDQDAYF